MGLDVIAMAAIAAASAGQAVVANKAAGKQEDIATAQAASEKAQRIAEQRQDFRRRRIAQARLMQSAENTGTSGSSLESGASSSISMGAATFEANRRGSEAVSGLITRRQKAIGDLNNISSALTAASSIAGSTYTIFG